MRVSAWFVREIVRRMLTRLFFSSETRLLGMRSRTSLSRSQAVTDPSEPVICGIVFRAASAFCTYGRGDCIKMSRVSRMSDCSCMIWCSEYYDRIMLVSGLLLFVKLPMHAR